MSVYDNIEPVKIIAMMLLEPYAFNVEYVLFMLSKNCNENWKEVFNKIHKGDVKVMDRFTNYQSANYSNILSVNITPEFEEFAEKILGV